MTSYLDGAYSTVNMTIPQSLPLIIGPHVHCTNNTRLLTHAMAASAQFELASVDKQRDCA